MSLVFGAHSRKSIYNFQIFSRRKFKRQIQVRSTFDLRLLHGSTAIQLYNHLEYDQKALQKVFDVIIRVCAQSSKSLQTLQHICVEVDRVR